MVSVELLFADLVGLEIELWNALDDRVRAEIGLPLSDCEGLRVIAERGKCRVNDLADDLSITVGGASKLADRLERGGYLTRQSNPDDRRSSVLELTSSGIAARKRAKQLIGAELTTRIDSRLTAAERHAFGSALRTLRQCTATAAYDNSKGTL